MDGAGFDNNCDSDDVGVVGQPNEFFYQKVVPSLNVSQHKYKKG